MESTQPKEYYYASHINLMKEIRGGFRISKRVERQPIILSIFSPENYMKIKETEPGAAVADPVARYRRPAKIKSFRIDFTEQGNIALYPLDPPLHRKQCP